MLQEKYNQTLYTKKENSQRLFNEVFFLTFCQSKSMSSLPNAGRIRNRGRCRGRGRGRGFTHNNRRYHRKNNVRGGYRNRYHQKNTNGGDIKFQLSLFENKSKALEYECRICQHVSRNVGELSR